MEAPISTTSKNIGRKVVLDFLHVFQIFSKFFLDFLQIFSSFFLMFSTYFLDFLSFFQICFYFFLDFSTFTLDYYFVKNGLLKYTVLVSHNLTPQIYRIRIIQIINVIEYRHYLFIKRVNTYFDLDFTKKKRLLQAYLREMYKTSKVFITQNKAFGKNVVILLDFF